MVNVQQVFNRLKKLESKKKKCNLFARGVIYLGYIISEKVVATNLGKAVV